MNLTAFSVVFCLHFRARCLGDKNRQALFFPPSFATPISTSSFLFCHLTSFVLKKGGEERQFYGSKCNYQASLWVSQVSPLGSATCYTSGSTIYYFFLFNVHSFYLWVDSLHSKHTKLLCFKEALSFYILLAWKYQLGCWTKDLSTWDFRLSRHWR